MNVWGLGLFFFDCFKANHSFLCNLNLVFSACPNVISVGFNVSEAKLVCAACLSPSDWLTGMEVPAPYVQNHMWVPAGTQQEVVRRLTTIAQKEMCYLWLWDTLLQNVMEIKNLARFKFGFSVTWKPNCREVNNQKNISNGCKTPSIEGLSQSLWAGRISLKGTIYPDRSFLQMLLNHHCQSQPMRSS